MTNNNDSSDLLPKLFAMPLHGSCRPKLFEFTDEQLDAFFYKKEFSLEEKCIASRMIQLQAPNDKSLIERVAARFKANGGWEGFVTQVNAKIMPDFLQYRPEK